MDSPAGEPPSWAELLMTGEPRGICAALALELWLSWPQSTWGHLRTCGFTGLPTEHTYTCDRTRSHAQKARTSQARPWAPSLPALDKTQTS